MTSKSWRDLVAGGFAAQTAPFAVHPLDERRAKEMYAKAMSEGASVEDIVAEARRYLLEQGVKPEFLSAQLDRVREFCNNASK